jgi:hypothetical protein
MKATKAKRAKAKSTSKSLFSIETLSEASRERGTVYPSGTLCIGAAKEP